MQPRNLSTDTGVTIGTSGCMKNFPPLIHAQENNCECRPLLHNIQHLQKAIHRKHPYFSQKFILFHDNTLPITECMNVILEHLHWKYLAQPTCSSDQITEDALQRENNSDVRME